ncbi:MAG: GNAT family N-acetyltransferase [Actinomycetota bacterium]
MEPAERLALGLVAAERARRANVVGAEVLEIDGLVLALANLADPALSSVVVKAEPRDATAALVAAEAEFVSRDLQFGIDLQVLRHPKVDAAVRLMGLNRIIERPGMVIDPRAIPDAPAPDGVEIRAVDGPDDAEALVQVGVLAFGDDPEVGRAFYGAAALGAPHARMFVGWRGVDPVGIASAYRDGFTVGVMGVGVVPAARGRGLGSAMTFQAARAFPGADLAWLHPSDEARSMYERLGFVSVSDWEVWVRGAAAVDVEAGAARLP